MESIRKESVDKGEKKQLGSTPPESKMNDNYKILAYCGISATML